LLGAGYKNIIYTFRTHNQGLNVLKDFRKT